MIIDHNKHEKRPTNTIWWILAAMLIFNWTGYLYFHSADWTSICLGLGTGIIVALWSLEVTGHLRGKDSSTRSSSGTVD
jgi:hypothetical protein